jgi:hypothetical protein
MVRHDCSPELSRAGLPDPKAGHRSAAVRAARSALASTGVPRAGLDGENDGVRSRDSASPPLVESSSRAQGATPLKPSDRRRFARSALANRSSDIDRAKLWRIRWASSTLTGAMATHKGLEVARRGRSAPDRAMTRTYCHIGSFDPDNGRPISTQLIDSTATTTFQDSIRKQESEFGMTVEVLTSYSGHRSVSMAVTKLTKRVHSNEQRREQQSHRRSLVHRILG